MSVSDARAGRWPNLLLGVAVIGCAWLAAFTIETAARLSSQTLRTAVVVSLGLRRSARYLHACIVSAVVSTMLVSLSALALSLPMVMCSEFWPAWPGATTGSVSKRASCR